MSLQLIATYDGLQEANAPLRTRRRAVVGGTLGMIEQSSPASPFADLPGTGVSPVLVNFGVGLTGLLAGIWIGRRWRKR